MTSPSRSEPTKQPLEEGFEITIPGQDTQLVLDASGNLAWRWAPGALDTSLNQIDAPSEQQAVFKAAVKSAAGTIDTYLYWMRLRRSSLA